MEASKRWQNTGSIIAISDSFPHPGALNHPTLNIPNPTLAIMDNLTFLSSVNNERIDLIAIDHPLFPTHKHIASAAASLSASIQNPQSHQGGYVPLGRVLGAVIDSGHREKVRHPSMPSSKM